MKRYNMLPVNIVLCCVKNEAARVIQKLGYKHTATLKKKYTCKKFQATNLPHTLQACTVNDY